MWARALLCAATMRHPLNFLLLLLIVGCNGSGASSSEPEADKDAGVTAPPDAASAQGFRPPCAAADGCPPFPLAENTHLAFRLQATDEGFASLSVAAVEEWTYATAKTRTVWTLPEGASPRAFAVGKTKVVVAFGDGSVWRASRNGEDARQVFTGGAKLMQIVARGDDFYWVSAADQNLVTLGADGTTKVLSNQTCNGLGLALAGDQAYVLSDTCRSILSIPLAGGARTTFWQDLAGGKPAYGATDGASLAWINLTSQDAGVNLSDLATGQTRLLAAFRDMPADAEGGNTSGVAVALDTDRVYFATRVAFAPTEESGHVYAVDRRAGTRVELSDHATNVKDIAVDDRLVVWAHWSATSYGLMARMK